jgi:hypothetical protein
MDEDMDLSNILTGQESHTCNAEVSIPASERLELWLSDHVLDHTSFIISVLLSFGYWFTNSDRINSLPFSNEIKSIIKNNDIYLIIILLILSVIAYWLQHRKSEKFSIIKRDNKLFRKENRELKESLSRSVQDMQSLCEGYLFSLAKGPLKFTNDPSSFERITLYAHDSGDLFIPIARFSFHPDYTKKRQIKLPRTRGLHRDNLGERIPFC